MSNSSYAEQSGAATHFCCPTRMTVCSMKIDEGNICGDVSIRYGFDPELRQCKPFMFKGCGGNENNFESVAGCLNFCGAAGKVINCVGISNNVKVFSDMLFSLCRWRNHLPSQSRRPSFGLY